MANLDEEVRGPGEDFGGVGVAPANLDVDVAQVPMGQQSPVMQSVATPLDLTGLGLLPALTK